MNRVCRQGQRSQRGAALLMLMTSMLGVTAYVLVQGVSVNRHKNLQQQEVTRSLAFAKSALIAYAVGYADHYGHNTRGGVGRLPCPSASRYGSPAMSCKQDTIGFLPGIWKRDGKLMEIDHLERFLNKDLWYAVSVDFRFNPSDNVLNSNTDQNFLTVDGDDEVIAVIIAPGPPIGDQSRGVLDYALNDYLESENADLDSEFSTAGAGNDQLVTITRSELMPLIERRVLGYVRDWLIEYRQISGHYPYAAPFGDPAGNCEQGLLAGKIPMQQGNCDQPALGDLVSKTVPKGRSLSAIWFTKSLWPELIFYQVNEHCVPGAAVGLCDSIDHELPSLTVNNTPAHLLLVSTGKAIATELVTQGQQREPLGDSAPVQMSSYFDTAALLTTDNDYALTRLDSIVLSGEVSNDQYLVVRK